MAYYCPYWKALLDYIYSLNHTKFFSYPRQFGVHLLYQAKKQIQHVVFEALEGFSFTNICFCMSFSSKNLDLMVCLNHLFKVSTVNFSSTEKRSDNDVDFSRARTEVAASFNWLKATPLNVLLPKMVQVVNFFCALLETSENNYFV